MRKPTILALIMADAIIPGGAALAQLAPLSPPQISLPDVTVVGSTPLLGSGIDREDIPAATNVLGEKDIDRTGIPSLTQAILDNIPGATINDVESNVFQPDILFAKHVGRGRNVIAIDTRSEQRRAANDRDIGQADLRRRQGRRLGQRRAARDDGIGHDQGEDGRFAHGGKVPSSDGRRGSPLRRPRGRER